MKKIIVILVLALFSITAVPATAGQASANLGACMADALTGKERKMLAQWIFLGMATHPQLQPFTNIAGEDRENTDKTIGALITRMLADDCPNETKTALKQEGSIAMQSAFELVGRVAVQELLTNQDVLVAMSSFERYIDKERLIALEKE